MPDPQAIVVHGAVEDVQVIDSPADLKGIRVTASERRLFGQKPSSEETPSQTKPGGPSATTDTRG